MTTPSKPILHANWRTYPGKYGFDYVVRQTPLVNPEPAFREVFAADSLFVYELVQADAGVRTDDGIPPAPPPAQSAPASGNNPAGGPMTGTLAIVGREALDARRRVPRPCGNPSLSATAITLGIAYLAVPILTRLYTPAEFGISDYFIMIASVLAASASLKYEDAIMLPEQEDRAQAVIGLAGNCSPWVPPG